MKISVFLFLIFFFAFNAKSQETNKIFNSTVITELNKPLIAAIDRHIEVSKAERIKNRRDFFILITIFPWIKESKVPKSVFDSLYSVNDFTIPHPSYSNSPTYGLSVVIISKEKHTEGWIRAGLKYNYYYKYEDYDILISSQLNINFNCSGEEKQIKIPADKKPYPKKNKYYKIWTDYSLWNNYISEIRIKDLIWPSWTSKRDDF